MFTQLFNRFTQLFKNGGWLCCIDSCVQPFKAHLHHGFVLCWESTYSEVGAKKKPLKRRTTVVPSSCSADTMKRGLLRTIFSELWKGSSSWRNLETLGSQQSWQWQNWTRNQDLSIHSFQITQGNVSSTHVLGEWLSCLCIRMGVVVGQVGGILVQVCLCVCVWPR